jgi:hypothetical protein
VAGREYQNCYFSFDVGWRVIVRPRLLNDVRFAECEEGVYLHSDRGSFVLAGNSTYAWMDRLAPFLTGEYTLEEISGDLPTAHGEMVRKFIAALAEQGFITDARTDRPHTLTTAEQSEYAEEIAFVRYGFDSAEWRFQQWREARVLVVGAGPVAVSTAEAGVRSGWRRPTIVCEQGESDVWRAAVKARRDSGQEIRRATTGDHLPGLIADADLVLQVDCLGRSGRLITVARECARAGVPLGQLLVRAEDAWLAATAGPDVEMGWRRLVARSGQPGQQHPLLTGAVPTVLAAQFVLAAFRDLTGMSEPDARLIRIDLRDLSTSAHQLPGAPVETPSAWEPEATRETIAVVRQANPDTVPGLLRRVRPFVDEHVGLISALSEGSLPQVPLAMCAAVSTGPGPAAPVVGWGDSREIARCRAVLGALAERAWSAVARRSSDRAVLWGQDVLTGDMRPVRADTLGFGGEYVPEGVAAGLSWVEAVEAGLLALWERAVRADESPAAVDIDGGLAETDRGIQDLFALLEQTGKNHRFRDHSKEYGLPVFSVDVDGRICALSVATSPVEALHGASSGALLAWQAGIERGTVTVPPIRRWVGVHNRPAPAGWATVRRLATTLRERTGCDPVVLVLDDGAVDPVLPFLVQVVLGDPVGVHG